MPISVRVLPSHGLVYVRYSGSMTVAETTRALAAYARHPDFRPGHKQLVDLTEITDWERDYLRLMQLQARKAEVFYDPAQPTMIVCLAPNLQSQKVAQTIQRSWDGLEGMISVVVHDEIEALALLGVAATSIAELLLSA